MRRVRIQPTPQGLGRWQTISESPRDDRNSLENGDIEPLEKTRTIRNVDLPPRWGLDSTSRYPGLAPWAAFFRRSAAEFNTI